MATFSVSAEKVLKKRYLLRDEAGEIIETPDDMFRRVAQCIASVEEEVSRGHWENLFYDLMDQQRFMPNTPALVNAGRLNSILSACFVLPIEDSMESIFETLKQSALIQKAGGGIGYAFYKLREENALVRSNNRQASGPLGFMETFDIATNTIKQGGVRRGACMGVLLDSHPDILKFIVCKNQEGKFTNFNISVAATDAFMEAVTNNEMFELISPLTGQVKQRLAARDIMQAIVDNAWANGEPGILFIDTINRDNKLSKVGYIYACNPCGESPLMDGEACNLGSINVANHLRKVGKSYEINWDSLEETTRTAVRLLDNVISVSEFPVPTIEKVKGNRAIGLGIMGWADTLIRLQIKYDSEDNLKLIDIVMGEIYRWADDESRQLGQEKGPFPNSHLADDKIKGRRNSLVTIIAPTGSISIIAGCSSGIEPWFAYATMSKRINSILLDVHPYILEHCNQHGIDLSAFRIDSDDANKLREQIGKLNDYLKGVLPEYFVTAGEISPEWHVKVQAQFQRYVDGAVSKTVNLPYSATKSDVEQAYILAWKLGCKGITIYRDGSREEQVLYNSSSKKDVQVQKNLDELDAKRYRIKTAQGETGYFVVSFDEDKRPLEVFVKGLKNLENPWDWSALHRVISVCMRKYGVPSEDIIRQLIKANEECGGHLYTNPALVARVLQRASQPVIVPGSVCPECNSKIRSEGACVTCDCGASAKCG